MSRDEQVFFDPGDTTLGEAGRRVAQALGVGYEVHEEAVTLVTTVESQGEQVDVHGTVETNIFSDSEPQSIEEEQIFDDMPYVLQLRTRKRQSEHQEAVAWKLYLALVSSLQWRSALTGEFSLLFAAYDADRGLRTFPRGTLSEGRDAHIWR